MFTFSDSGEPQAAIAVQAAGIQLAAQFKFNNSAMWSTEDGELKTRYFDLGYESFRQFT